jgi:hypothetical protein
MRRIIRRTLCIAESTTESLSALLHTFHNVVEKRNPYQSKNRRRRITSSSHQFTLIQTFFPNTLSILGQFFITVLEPILDSSLMCGVQEDAHLKRVQHRRSLRIPDTVQIKRREITTIIPLNFPLFSGPTAFHVASK